MSEREEWEWVEQIFHSALGLDPIARAEYVRRECGDNHELRRRVESLLESDKGTSPIDRPLGAEPLGRSFGRYRLISKLGEGGMGTVYLARDTQLNRDVAIKTLPPAFAVDAARQRRFLREARAASALSHSNIVPVHDFGQEGGIDYYVMEYVRGKPLDRLIPRTGLKLDEALGYAIPIARALEAAHEAGIVHRDVKPANVIVDEQGVPKVLDFGIAKLAAEHSTPQTAETSEGMVVGTAAYMSPEQAEGRAVDARSDIFSFGSLLYELITGRRAFDRGSNASTLTAILRDDPPSAKSLVPGIPPELSEVLERCLRKNPAQRYQRMDDVLVNLDRVRAAFGGGSKRGLSMRYGVAAALLLVCAVGAWWLVKARDAPAASRERTGSAAQQGDLRPIPLTSEPGEVAWPSFSPDGNQVAFTYREPGDEASHVFLKMIGRDDAAQRTGERLPITLQGGLQTAAGSHSCATPGQQYRGIRSAEDGP